PGRDGLRVSGPLHADGLALLREDHVDVEVVALGFRLEPRDGGRSPPKTEQTDGRLVDRSIHEPVEGRGEVDQWERYARQGLELPGRRLHPHDVQRRRHRRTGWLVGAMGPACPDSYRAPHPDVQLV